jgi:signal transduction histidine kinase
LPATGPERHARADADLVYIAVEVLRPDPLAAIELVAILEEATSPLRHDVSNRLASVGNMAYFVRSKLGQAVADTNPRAASFLEQIAGEVRLTDTAVESWLTQIRAMRPSLSRSSAVADCLRLAVEAARLPGSACVEVVPGANGERVAGDLETVAVALRCLIENAAEAPSTCITLTTRASQAGCTIRVADAGPGIAEPTRCLERFYTTKPGHLGLGLCVAKSVASRFGGSLEVRSSSAGAEVALYLPLAGGSGETS